MRFVYCLIVAFIITSCQVPNDWDRDNLNGDIQSVTKYQINLRTPAETNIVSTSFSNTGWITRKVSYQNTLSNSIYIQDYLHSLPEHLTFRYRLDKQGNTNQVSEIRYTENGKIKEITTTHLDANIIEREVFLYDRHTQLTQRSAYTNSKLVLRKDYLYSSKGSIDILISTIPGLMTIIWRHFYDKKGNLHFIISDQQKIEKLYDKHSRLTQETQLLPGDITLYKKLYQYDGHNNVIHMTEYESISNDWTLIREEKVDITYFK